MTGFDFAVIAIFLVSMLLGLWRGLIYEVMLLIGWPLAFVLSRLFVDDLVALMPSLVDSTLPPTVQDLSFAAASYVLVFIAVLIGWAMLTKLMTRLMKAAGAGWTDRIWGALFGMFRGGLVVLVMVWLLGLTAIPKHPLWRDALLSDVLEHAAQLTKVWLPEIIAQRISY